MGVVNAALSPEDRARIDARYPRRTKADLAVGIVAGVALTLAVGMIVLGGLIRSTPDVAAMIRSFDVVSPQLMVAEVVVQRTDPEQPAECFVYAQAVSYERVAEMTLEIPPGTETLTVMDIEIATVKEATAVSIENCRITD